MLNKTDRLISLLNVQVRTLAFCAIASGTRLALPAGSDAKVLYMLAGEAELVGSAGGTTPCRPGMMLFIPPAESFEIRDSARAVSALRWEDAAAPGGDMLLVTPRDRRPPAIEFACVMIPAQSLSFRLLHDLSQPLCQDLGDDPTAVAAFHRMLAELRNPRFGTKVMVEALMMQCYVLALRALLGRAEEQFRPMNEWGEPRLGEALLTMIGRPEAEHSLESLARSSGMSRTMFAQRFARAFGRSPVDMLKEIRMHRAASLLKTTNMPVGTVAAAVGYESRSYFSRAFKSSFGMDPTAFRKQGPSVSAEPFRIDIRNEGAGARLEG